MQRESKPSRYAHNEGHTDLTFDDSGRYVLTCGSDGDVRIWEGLDTDDPVSHRGGDILYAVAYQNNCFYTAGDDNSVRAHTFKEGLPDGVITRFTGHVTHMCFNKDGSKLYAGACDFLIKGVDVESKAQNVYQGHEAPILSIAVNNEETYLASSSCDGTVRIWSVQNTKEIKKLSLLKKTNDFSASETLCRLAWSKCGKFLLIPVGQEILVYKIESWELAFSLKPDVIKESVSIVRVSPCGKYLAAAGRDGMIYIWNFSLRKCISKIKHVKSLTITALAWNPSANNELVYCDKEGYLGMVDNVVPSNTSTENEEMNADQLADLFDDNDDDNMLLTAEGVKSDDSDDEGSIGGGKMKKKVRAILEDENSMDIDIGKIKSSIPGLFDDDDDLASGRSSPSNVPAPQAKPAPVIVKGFEPTAMQPPFQPSSTPEHLSHRFMVWNSIGIIQQYSTDEENSIDIQFHDTATHHAMHLTNRDNHIMAALSSEAAVFASEAEYDVPSKLLCMHFSSWDSKKEWNTCMPEGESIEAITLGEGWVAVATDKRFVRVFSISGIQKEIFSIPGPVVALTGHTAQLLVTYHRGMAIPGDQNIAVKLLHITGKKRFILDDSLLPLGAKSTLTWIGFSAEGTPFCMDSSGAVRMLNRKFSFVWMEVANTKKHAKGKSDNYWIIGVHENPQQLRCVLCKGSKYPATLPKPTVTILPFKLPLCEIEAEKGQLEEDYWKTKVFSNHLDYLQSCGYDIDDSSKNEVAMAQQATLMKQFALACKMEREFRAVELCEMMPSQHMVQLAIKYASRLKLMQLAQRLNDIAERKAEEDLAGEEEEEEVIQIEHVPVRSSRAGSFKTIANRTPAEEADVDMDEDANTSIYEEIDDEQDEEKEHSGPMLNLQRKEKEATPKTISLSGRPNPFKVGSQKTPTTGKGTSVFDSMNKSASGNKKSPGASVEIKPSKVRIPKKKNSQAKLFNSKVASEQVANSTVENKPANTKANKTGFQLWMDANNEDLLDEHPDVSAADLTMLAARKFKELPDDEKKEWQNKAKQGDSTEGDMKKRKREEDTKSNDSDKDTTSKKKKLLSDSTNSKLANFAFGN